MDRGIKSSEKGFVCHARALEMRVRHIVERYRELNKKPGFRSGSHEPYSPEVWSMLGIISEGCHAADKAAEEAQKAKSTEKQAAVQRNMVVRTQLEEMEGNSLPLSIDQSTASSSQPLDSQMSTPERAHAVPCATPVDARERAQAGRRKQAQRPDNARPSDALRMMIGKQQDEAGKVNAALQVLGDGALTALKAAQLRQGQQIQSMQQQLQAMTDVLTRLASRLDA